LKDARFATALPVSGVAELSTSAYIVKEVKEALRTREMEGLLLILVMSLPLDAALLLLWCGPVWKDCADPSRFAAIWCAETTLSGRA
jgi:hypothetical protein